MKKSLYKAVAKVFCFVGWAFALVLLVSFVALLGLRCSAQAKLGQALRRAEEVGISLAMPADIRRDWQEDVQAVARMDAAIALAQVTAESRADRRQKGSRRDRSDVPSEALRCILLEALAADGDAFAVNVPWADAPEVAAHLVKSVQLSQAVHGLAAANIAAGDVAQAHVWPLVLLGIGGAYAEVPWPDGFRWACASCRDAKELAETILMQAHLPPEHLATLQEAFAREQLALSPKGAIEGIVQRAVQSLKGTKETARPDAADMHVLAADRRGSLGAGTWGIGSWRNARAKAAEIEVAARAYEVCGLPSHRQYEYAEATLEPVYERCFLEASGGTKTVNLTLAEYLTEVIRDCIETKAALCLAQTGIAIERFRLEHGQWPENLEALVPEFLDDVPLDPMTGRHLSYAVADFGAITWAGAEEDVAAWPVPDLCDLGYADRPWAFILFNKRPPDTERAPPGR